MVRKKKHKMRALFLIFCLISIAVYGGYKGGEYLANKLTKPVGGSNSVVDGAKDTGNQAGETTLSENDIVTVTSVVTQYISSQEGEASDIDYIEIDKEKVKLVVKYLKGSETFSETLALTRDKDTWKVTK